MEVFANIQQLFAPVSTLFALPEQDEALKAEIARVGEKNGLPEHFAVHLDMVAMQQLPPSTLAKMVAGRMTQFQTAEYNPQNPRRAKVLYKLNNDDIKRQTALRFAFVTGEAWKNSPISALTGDERDKNGIRQEVLYVGAIELYNEIKPIVKEYRMQQEIDRNVRQVFAEAGISVEGNERKALGERLVSSQDPKIAELGKYLVEENSRASALITDIPMQALVEAARFGDAALQAAAK